MLSAQLADGAADGRTFELGLIQRVPATVAKPDRLKHGVPATGFANQLDELVCLCLGDVCCKHPVVRGHCLERRGPEPAV